MDFLDYNSSYISKTRIHGRRKVLSFEWSPSCVFDLSSAVATKMVLWSVWVIELENPWAMSSLALQQRKEEVRERESNSASRRGGIFFSLSPQYSSRCRCRHLHHRRPHRCSCRHHRHRCRHHRSCCRCHRDPFNHFNSVLTYIENRSWLKFQFHRHYCEQRERPLSLFFSFTKRIKGKKGKKTQPSKMN